MNNHDESLLTKLKNENDIVYEVFKKPKRSFLFHIWDTLFDVVPSTTDSLLNMDVVYLVANEHSGKLVQFENNNKVSELNIENWSASMKESFKKITINGFVYKKYRKL